MTPPEIERLLRSTRTELERICTLLESPSPSILDRCATALECVTVELLAGRKRTTQASQGEVAEARRLQSTLWRVRSLLDLAANYHARWRSILAGMSGGYTVWGSPTPVPGLSRLSVRG